MTQALIEKVQFNQQGLVPVVVQDAHSHRVLMLAHMNLIALQTTLATGEMTFWSRSRQTLWVKGATSGNRQQLVELLLDCDGDSLLAKVTAAGPACHNGTVSCFEKSFKKPLHKETNLP